MDLPHLPPRPPRGRSNHSNGIGDTVTIWKPLRAERWTFFSCPRPQPVRLHGEALHCLGPGKQHRGVSTPSPPTHSPPSPRSLPSISHSRPGISLRYPASGRIDTTFLRGAGRCGGEGGGRRAPAVACSFSSSTFRRLEGTFARILSLKNTLQYKKLVKEMPGMASLLCTFELSWGCLYLRLQR